MLRTPHSIPEFPGIYVDRRGDPWRLAKNGRWYGAGFHTGPATTDMKVLQFLAPFKLMTEVWVPEWVVVERFPKYEINRSGVVRNIRTGREKKPDSRGGTMRLQHEGHSYSVKIASMIARAFGEQS